MPIENNNSLDSILQNTNDKNIITNTIKKVILIINCIVNPSLIVIGGDFFKDKQMQLDIEKLKEHTHNKISNLMYPDVKFISEYKDNYLLGLYSLTLQKIMSDIINY